MQMEQERNLGSNLNLKHCSGHSALKEMGETGCKRIGEKEVAVPMDIDA